MPRRQARMHSSSVAFSSPQRRFSRIVPENSTFFCNTTDTSLRKSFQIIVSDVLATDINGTLIDIIQTADEVHQTGLGASGTTQDTDGLTGFDLEIQVI